ncbi:hypothetical protein [Tritonibacter mobilis]|uniref:Uncharacterized protein n=1 Tax=Tritonibacter mobilis F1926 TaxID=1265309 RepID=A0A1B1A6I9_9RHOB|nr:hypothetical protein [Tritonibacter mobilis]ANP42183.1 hypothetical protein K529_015495 [Tritonibacter mobilis F1926]KJZ22285.1 hypothetical protein TW79_18835 [Tritonibacter mobilis]
MTPEQKLEYYINNSENLEGGEFWFSLRNQKYYAFIIAKELLIAGAEPDEAIDLAMEFVNGYYNNAIRKGAWKL